MRKVWFKGEEYFLIGKGDNVAIATKEQYENGLCSFAHLKPNGNIYRFGEIIGTKKDLDFKSDEDLKVNDDAFMNIGLHPSWRIF